MDLNEIKNIITLLEDSSLNFLELTEGDSKLTLIKNGTGRAVETSSSNDNFSSIANTGTENVEPIQVENIRSNSSTGTAVKAPMVGAFYTAPSPQDEPFVKVGDTVEKGTTLCIIEAMKMMNEIVAQTDGVIKEICVENGAVVEYGQTLFYIG